MRVICTGSRDWTGYEGERRVDEVLSSLEEFVLFIGQAPMVIVHGNCPSGLDAIVDRWALRRGYEPIRYDANWGKFGNAAGPIRNQVMVEGGADMCLGFPLPGSTGTIDCMNRARAAGILTISIPWEQRTFEPASLFQLPEAA